MRYAIVTGASKGLGKSIAKIMMESGIHVIGISRTNNEELIELAKEHNVTYDYLACDLGDVEQVESVSKTIKDKVFDADTVYLINNAGILDPIDKSMNISTSALTRHFQVNTIAPMIMTNILLKEATAQDIPLIATTITSGAAERPVYGWSAYCSSKASMNMYTKSVAIEQTELNTQNKIIAFSPGVMDTQMQEKIRASNKDEFIEVDTFKNYKKKNLLKETDAVAGVLVDILTDETNVENGKIYSVKDYY